MSTAYKITSLAPQFLVDDIERSIAFYRDRLGLEFHTWSDFYAIGLWNGLELHLKRAAKNVSEREFRQQNQHLDASIGVTGIDALYERCQAQNVPIVKPLENTDWGTRDFCIQDPDGYIICFGE